MKWPSLTAKNGKIMSYKEKKFGRIDSDLILFGIPNKTLVQQKGLATKQTPGSDHRSQLFL